LGANPGKSLKSKAVPSRTPPSVFPTARIEVWARLATLPLPDAEPSGEPVLAALRMYPYAAPTG
jgi:hypothetical protein